MKKELGGGSLGKVRAQRNRQYATTTTTTKHEMKPPTKIPQKQQGSLKLGQIPKVPFMDIISATETSALEVKKEESDISSSEVIARVKCETLEWIWNSLHCGDVVSIVD